MIGWALSLWTGLGLRVRLTAIAVTSAALALGYLWVRLRLATRRAQTAQERAVKLEATRALEQRIAASQASVRARQAKVRREISQRKERDYFER